MKTPEQTSAGSGLEPIGDPDTETPDFAEEHEQFVVGGSGDDSADHSGGGDDEEAGRYAGGLDGDGPP
jgi:hypothetical protein